MRAPRGLAPLRRTPFRRFWVGQAVSNIGDLFYAVALPWYVLANHGSVVLLGTVLTAYGIPRTVGVALGGSLADRFRPWTVMIGTDAVRAVAIGALTLVASTQTASTAALIPIALVFGAASGLFLPCAGSVTPALVPDRELMAANALVAGSEQSATLIGPALGGAAVALLGPSVAFGVDAVSFLISAATLIAVRGGMRVSAAAAAAPGAPGAEIAAGAGADTGAPDPQVTFGSLLRRESFLHVALAFVIAANLGIGAVTEVALPALAHGPFDSGAGGYGGLIAALGGGGLLGVIAAAQSRSFRRPTLPASGVFLLAAACLALTPYLGGTLPAAATLVAFGALIAFGNTLLITAIQQWTPPHLMGHMMGVLMLGSLGLFPLSTLLGGLIVHADGPSVLFPANGALFALAVLGGLTRSAWRDFSVAAPPPPADTAAAIPGVAAQVEPEV